MSRSYKHTPRSGDKKSKYFKRYSNHKVRRLPIDEHSSKGKAYKKVLHDYSICDFETVGTSFEQYWKSLVKRWHEWRIPIVIRHIKNIVIGIFANELIFQKNFCII